MQLGKRPLPPDLLQLFEAHKAALQRVADAQAEYDCAADTAKECLIGAAQDGSSLLAPLYDRLCSDTDLIQDCADDLPQNQFVPDRHWAAVRDGPQKREADTIRALNDALSKAAQDAAALSRLTEQDAQFEATQGAYFEGMQGPV